VLLRVSAAAQSASCDKRAEAELLADQNGLHGERKGWRSDITVCKGEPSVYAAIMPRTRTLRNERWLTRTDRTKTTKRRERDRPSCRFIRIGRRSPPVANTKLPAEDDGVVKLCSTSIGVPGQKCREFTCSREYRAQLDVEQYVDAVAQRYGFAPRDLRVRWDTTDARAAGSVHELVIQTVNGHQASSIAIEHKALIEQDRWRFVPRIEDAITSLRDQLLHT